MARSLRGSRYRGADTIGEDVNPSAYIVNLADCMLVLALGCLVALVGAFNIDLNMTEIDRENLEQVDPTEIENDLTENGSYYVEAGTVYMDPRTGELFMIQPSDAETAPDGAQEGQSADAAAADGESAQAQPAQPSFTGSGSDDAVRQARANGAD